MRMRINFYFFYDLFLLSRVNIKSFGKCKRNGGKGNFGFPALNGFGPSVCPNATQPKGSAGPPLSPAQHALPHPSKALSVALCLSQVSTMEPWLEDLTDDSKSMSFNSTTTATDINRSTSSGSETTWTTAASGGFPPATSKPHASSGDPCWDGIRRARSESPAGALSFSDLRFVQRLGSGDIGSVYLVELKAAEGCSFAAKVMDKKELAGRNKEGRARTEREILEMLDHPFLPALYATIDSPKCSCLLTEFCPGGDLHVLRQRQPAKRFHESAVRCAR